MAKVTYELMILRFRVVLFNVRKMLKKSMEINTYINTRYWFKHFIIYQLQYFCRYIRVHIKFVQRSQYTSKQNIQLSQFNVRLSAAQNLIDLFFFLKEHSSTNEMITCQKQKVTCVKYRLSLKTLQVFKIRLLPLFAIILMEMLKCLLLF